MSVKYAVYDIENYPNYFLIGFKLLDTNEVKQFEIKNDEVLTALNKREILNIVQNYHLIGFNNKSYDDNFLHLILNDNNYNANFTAYELDKFAEDLIKTNNYNGSHLKGLITIDLYKLVRDRQSLKYYASLLGVKIEELPIKAHENLSEANMRLIKTYNVNDLIVTEKLYLEFKSAIDLRHQLNIKEDSLFYSSNYNPFRDKRNMGEATLGFSIISKTCKFNTNVFNDKYKKSWNFKNDYFMIEFPEWLKFKDDYLNSIITKLSNHKFRIKDNYSLIMPDFLETFNFCGLDFKLALGGLHSQDDKLIVDTRNNDNLILRNIDVTSYYPSLIMNYGITPRNTTTKNWVNTIMSLFLERVEAKQKAKQLKKKLKANGSLSSNELDELNNANLVNATNKIALNGGVYGKLGDKFSKSYDPKALLTVTLYGQLFLLNLIERLSELDGVTVISSNTDGIELIHDKTKCSFEDIQDVVSIWEILSGMSMEYGEYLATFNQSVNDYVAIYSNEIKAKGDYALDKIVIGKSLKHPVVFKAIKNYLKTKDINEIEKTIKSEDKLINFCISNKVKGGAIITNEDNVNDYKREKPIEGSYKLIPKSKRIKIDGVDIVEYIYFKISGKKTSRATIKKAWLQHPLVLKYADKIFDYSNPKMQKYLNLKAFNNKSVGSVVRYIYTNKGYNIFYKANGSSVPNAKGVKLLQQDLSTYDNWRELINYDYYINLAKEYLIDKIGVKDL